jgi:hypothetical protein
MEPLNLGKKKTKNFEVTTVRLQGWQREGVRRLGGSVFIRAAITAAIEGAIRDGLLPLFDNEIRRLEK